MSENFADEQVSWKTYRVISWFLYVQVTVLIAKAPSVANIHGNFAVFAIEDKNAVRETRFAYQV